MASWSLLHLYDGHVTRILAAARWRYTDRLGGEFTYYERECQAEDLSTLRAADLVVGRDDPASHVMEHGFGLVREVLSPRTAARMREFVLRRNADLTAAESIPLDGEGNRWSFAIGANEDPAVPDALAEVAAHPVVRPMLEGLLGPDPAVVEITAITSAHGAEHQGWHADVKPLGTAVKYARTFVHSYSLFVALQDTTGDMGATEVCPGTHYCSNDLGGVCARDGFKVTQGGGTWRAGDALLLNQCAWHRGTAHVDPGAQERAVFIVTFLSRPDFGGSDHRQLAHGTYFHIRWDMWGHTLRDLTDAPRHMVRPLTWLRSAGLWKPRDRRWGWDWLTVACLRIANDQNGYTPYELVEWVEEFGAFGLPAFLLGPVSDADGAWQAFLRGTLEQIVRHSALANAAALAAYLALVLLIGLVRSRGRTALEGGGGRAPALGPALGRLLRTHGAIAASALGLVCMVHRSPWSRSLMGGAVLRRPFPEAASVAHPSTPGGPTTTPSRYDVLIGSRFDSRAIGKYNDFLDYHPGNVLWRSLLSDHAPAFAAGEGSALIQSGIAESLARIVREQRGRYLLQNEFGDWVRLSSEQSIEHTRRALLKWTRPVIEGIDQEIAFMLAEARYGSLRETSLAQFHGVRHLLDLRERLLSVGKTSSSQLKDAAGGTEPMRSMKPSLFSLSPPTHSDWTTSRELAKSNLISIEERDHVLGNFEGSGVWFEARVRGVADDGQYHVEYADGDTEALGLDRIQPFGRPLEEGDEVIAELEEGEECLGTIIAVAPSKICAIRCEGSSEHFFAEPDNIKRLF